MRGVFKVIGWIFKASRFVLLGLVVATPLLGVWLASSLAAYLNGPIWAACLAGALLFPLVPMLWEAVAQRRYHRKVAPILARSEKPRARILGLKDRVILRTLVVNLVFLGVLGGLFPQDGFMALATRGDWMLRGQNAGWATQARRVLFGAAGGLEWLYNASRDNPYERYADTVEDSDSPVPRPVPGEVERAKIPKARVPEQGEGFVDTPPNVEPVVSEDPAPLRNGMPVWPMPARLHPVVAQMRAGVETSPEAVAAYIAEREQDPYLRVKALYDYVADRIRYDAPALAAGVYPPQDVETVFETKTAVCAGYAKLLQRMARSVGIEMHYVVGVSRDMNGGISGYGHAWNSVEIEGKWYLIDVTWGSGTVEGSVFTKRYSTNYLFTPANVFGVEHFPDDPRWQLRSDPLTRGEFIRQPMLDARFYKLGYELISPQRSQISVGHEAVITLNRPPGQFLVAAVFGEEGGQVSECEIGASNPVSVRCPIARPGSYQVRMFSNAQRSGSYAFIGKIAVNSR